MSNPRNTRASLLTEAQTKLTQVEQEFYEYKRLVENKEQARLQLQDKLLESWKQEQEATLKAMINTNISTAMANGLVQINQSVVKAMEEVQHMVVNKAKPAKPEKSEKPAKKLEPKPAKKQESKEDKPKKAKKDEHKDNKPKKAKEDEKTPHKSKGEKRKASEAAEGEEKPKKAKKARKPKGYPKGQCGSYAFFTKMNATEFKEENPHATFQERGKLLGEAWRAMSVEAKKPYQDQAAADKIRYKAEMSKWNEEHPDEEKDMASDDEPAAAKAKKPKGFRSPLLFFSKSKAAEIKAENPDATLEERRKLLGAAWRALSEESKQPFQEQARADKARYASEMLQWNQDHPVVAAEDQDQDMAPAEPMEAKKSKLKPKTKAQAKAPKSLKSSEPESPKSPKSPEPESPKSHKKHEQETMGYSPKAATANEYDSESGTDTDEEAQDKAPYTPGYQPRDVWAAMTPLPEPDSPDSPEKRWAAFAEEEARAQKDTVIHLD